MTETQIPFFRPRCLYSFIQRGASARQGAGTMWSRKRAARFFPCRLQIQRRPAISVTFLTLVARGAAVAFESSPRSSATHSVNSVSPRRLREPRYAAVPELMRFRVRIYSTDRRLLWAARSLAGVWRDKDHAITKLSTAARMPSPRLVNTWRSYAWIGIDAAKTTSHLSFT